MFSKFSSLYLFFNSNFPTFETYACISIPILANIFLDIAPAATQFAVSLAELLPPPL